MFNMKPSISIVIPTFNEEKYLEETLESISKQTINYRELIIELHFVSWMFQGKKEGFVFYIDEQHAAL